MSDPNDPNAPGDEPTDEVPVTPSEPGPADEPTTAAMPTPVTVPAPPPGAPAPAYAADASPAVGPVDEPSRSPWSTRGRCGDASAQGARSPVP